MKQIVLFLTAFCAAMPAWAQDEGRWDYRKMESRVRRVCSGSNGNWILRMGHPRLTIRSLYRNWTDGQVFTESILAPEISGRLMDFTQTHMIASENCYEVSGLFLSYELMGFEALNDLREAFQDSGITENCAHTSADEELRSLYLQCSKIEFASRFTSETGKTLVFSQDMIAGVRKRIANKLLIERRPTTCQQIEELDEEIYRGFMHAHQKFIQKLNAGGIDLGT
jgi:hypothetical protein